MNATAEEKKGDGNKKNNSNININNIHMQNNIITHNFGISRKERSQAKGHGSFLVWFTGLSGSGKSTLANALENRLYEEGVHTYVLDGDNIRTGLNADLDFRPEHRTENIRRIGEVARLMIDAGLVVMAAFVSPYRKDRQEVARRVGEENYVEVFVNTSLEECEKRDVKGLYKKAREGKITNMTGISAPYEAPEAPDVVVDSSMSVEEATEKVFKTILNKLKSKSNE